MQQFTLKDYLNILAPYFENLIRIISLQFLVVAYTALCLLFLTVSLKVYVFIMVSLLKKLPDEPSSDPLSPVSRPVQPIFPFLATAFTGLRA